MRIAAVDDETHVLERFARMAAGVPELSVCGLFETGEQLLAYLRKNPLDAVFLDIEMPGVSGLELSEQIQNLNENIDIIFVTAFNQYAVEAFELQAMDYIMKPMTEERLGKTIKRLLKTKRRARPQEKPFIQCLGGFDVFLNGKALTWKSSKAKEVLAFLVYKKGVPVGWEKITDAVWPDFNSEKAQANFHATNYLLRKRLAEAGLAQILKSERGNYRIVADKFDCDVYRLEEMLKNSQLKSNAGLRLLEELVLKGYMEASGYGWAYPRAAELDDLCRKVLAE
ncbi:response regulator containing CheY-like receiver and SARP domains [Desulfosporosinus acidiphilus SJ4]|uniref:Stage 0 sporulation protein A homolog n=1 Tax=Desulfosporosinus acidiphilus (strain DSM 22704 / JCM 16185 / SJ4) TaxID=646529 RepID=I4DC62_DESAJ|nr:response regulator [Desulfosporosinus acidiphilus]AFM43386.1 response regulator containing CheY-like receiver and SARP domains [Desulfosporosinus acidiphilus SJ4]